MANPIRMVESWSRRRKIKAELLAAARQARPSGLEVPLEKVDPEVATAVHELLKERPELEVVGKGRFVTLYHRADIDPLMAPPTRQLLGSAGLLSTGSTGGLLHG